MSGWIICPKCHDACEGVVGQECFECDTPMVATPLYASTEPVERPEAVCKELGYSTQELALLEEFGV